MSENELRFQGYIADVLANKPEWLGSAVAGITAGMQRAIKASHEREAAFHMAMCCALSLAGPNRLNQEAKDTLGGFIKRTIDKYPGGTLAEAKFQAGRD